MALDYDCTYASIGFIAVEDRALLTPLFGTKAKSAVREVPYGDRAIYQYLGRGTAQVQVTIQIETADYPALQAKVGTSGTLALHGGPSVSGVVLDSLDQAGQDSINGLTECVASFLRVG